MPESVRYARSGDAHIAFQTVGAGPPDIVWIQGWVSNLELAWEQPDYAAFLRRLAGFSRLILLDKRGTGLSDRVPLKQEPMFKERMDDVRAVMDDAGRRARGGLRRLRGRLGRDDARRHPPAAGVSSPGPLRGLRARGRAAPDTPRGRRPRSSRGS